MPYLFAITIVQADESPLDENFQLPVLMVTGEKIERTLQDTASAVGVVSTQQLEGLPESRGVSDVIKDFPNVFIPILQELLLFGAGYARPKLRVISLFWRHGTPCCD